MFRIMIPDFLFLHQLIVKSMYFIYFSVLVCNFFFVNFIETTKKRGKQSFLTYSWWPFSGLLTDVVGGKREGGGKMTPFLKILHTYPAMANLGTVITYLKKIKKNYKSCDTPLGFCLHSIFSTEISSFCHIKKYRYKLHFNT